MHSTEKNLVANDVVRYSIFLGLLLIFLATNSILFGILSVCMGLYFIVYEYRNILKKLTKYIQFRLYIKIIISVIIFMMFTNSSMVSGAGSEACWFISQIILYGTFFVPCFWNEKIYFDERTVNFVTLFTTKNGSYVRTKTIAQKLNIDLSFPTRWQSFDESERCLDKLAKSIIKNEKDTLQKYKLILSLKEQKDMYGLLLRNIGSILLMLILCGKAGIQIQNISGLEFTLNLDNFTKTSIAVAVVLVIVYIFPMLKNIIKDNKIAKKREIIILIIDRAIQMKDEYK